MVLGQWLERGLGQILAPDDNYEPDPVAEASASPFWSIVAPDPNFSAPRTAGTPSSPGDGHGPMVRCVHCHRDTPTTNITPAQTLSSSKVLSTPSPKFSQQTFMSPPSQSQAQGQLHPDASDPENAQLFQGIVQNAYAHADSMRSPGNVKDKRREFLRLCASSKPLKKKPREKLRRLLEADHSLASCRATDLGGSVPNGYTPFMAAAYANNMDAAEILLDVMGSYLLTEVDTMGKTPLHIAAEHGHLEMIEFLQKQELEAFGPEAIPKVDITGQTALGLGLTSPEGKAITNKRQLEKMLFSPKDRSIFGSPAPVQQRAKADAGLGIVYGLADMPGKRIIMEDAMVATSWEQACLGSLVGLFAVCDGHGDNGQVSNYVAEQIPMVLPGLITEHTTSAAETGEKAHVAWELCCKRACLQVDTELKAVDVPGGSTTVMALVTNDTIVVANVGDSRCILIQQTQTATKDETAGGLEEAVAQLSLNKESPQSVGSEKSSAAKKITTTHSVKELSHDHKPDLEEEQVRIEKAGLKVFAESFQEDGQEVTIHKVELSDDERIACSRSFGDFEYKANESLGDDEQAIVAVPDVVIHERDSERDSYLVLACDGVWDVMTNEQVADFVVEHVELLADKDEVGILPSVGDQLLAECLKLGSGDNMSVIVVALAKAAEKVSGGKFLQGKTLDFTA
jgi:serine/threonine protein phosphatase PrpC